jgi:predicted metal-binding protein
MTSTITICDTCKREGWSAETHDKTDGESLAMLVEAAAAANPNVSTRRHSCLMGCARGCNIAIQAPGKLTYVLGRFEADTESAEGIVAYADLHAQNDNGQVPFRTWPQAVKGHFVSRIPLLPSTED